jgi:hypothetical protein
MNYCDSSSLKKICKASLCTLLFFTLAITNANAACCVAQEFKVVEAGEKAISALKQYGNALDVSLESSRSATQSLMAQTIEKQHILNDLYSIKRNTELRADVKADMIQQVLLRNEALLMLLSSRYNKSTATEINTVEGIRK